MVDVIVLASGTSSRFGDKLKQFITFAVEKGGPERQMFENAVSSLTVPATLWVALRSDLLGRVAGCRRAFNVAPVPHTRGQGESLLRALSALPEQGDLLVLNCDVGWAPDVLDSFVEEAQVLRKDSAIVFDSGITVRGLDRNGNQVPEVSPYSHVNAVPEFRFASEKLAVSPWAMAGAYYFVNRPELARALRTSMGNWSREPYISQAYVHIAGKKNAFVIDKEQWLDWGTPEALARYLNNR